MLRLGAALEERRSLRATARFCRGGSGMSLIAGRSGDWEVVIGLEVHAQVTSRAKLFSGAATEFGAAPNTQVSTVDAAFPGMLPVINRFCVEQAVRTGLGLAGRDQSRLGVRPQELFLSRSAGGISDLAIYAADRRQGRDRARSPRRRLAHGRHHAAASRAGCRQEPARPASELHLCRSQPCRRRA